MNATAIHDLLENKKLKIIIDSRDNNYYFEYFSRISINRWTKEKRLVRSYRLVDRTRNQIISEPWDAYDLDKQTVLVTNLIVFSGYQITKITGGWQATCPSCGKIIQRDHWEKPPSKCDNRLNAKQKCRTQFQSTDVAEIISIIPYASAG